MFEDFHDLNVHGVSISLYDPGHRAWYQTFVDNLGGRLVLAGGLVGGAMLLTRPDKDHRITWEALAGDGAPVRRGQPRRRRHLVHDTSICSTDRAEAGGSRDR